MFRYLACFALLWLATTPGNGQQPLHLLHEDSLAVISDNALDDLVRKLRFGGGSAEEYLLAAKNIMLQNTISKRKLASKLLREAVLKYPVNAALKLAYASLLKYQGFKTQARENFEQALAIDSTDGWGWYQLGELYQAKMDKFKDEVSAVSSAMDFERFALKYYDLAQRCYDHCIDLKFGSDSLRIKMFWLYYQAGEYDRAQKAVSDSNANWHLKMLNGLASYRLKNFEASDLYFSAARQNWPQPWGKDFIASTRLVAPADSTPFEQVFAGNDPLLITLYNERELAHTARFIYAKERFSLPKFDVNGWESDRGKVLIKYGFPKAIHRYRAEIENNRTLPPTIIWYYPGFQLVFSDTHRNGNYRFAEPDLLGTFGSRSRVVSSSALNAENIFNEVRELYALQTSGGEIKPPLELIDRRNENNIEFLWLQSDSLPARVFNGWQFQFFEQKQNHLVGRPFRPNLKIWHRDSLYHFKALLPVSAEVPLNALNGRFEGYNSLSHQFFTIPVNKNLSMWQDSLIFMSDTELSYYSFDNRGEPHIVPTAVHQFRKHDELYISFSLQNLSFNKTADNTLSAEFNLEAIPPETSLWQDMISIFSGSIKLPETVAISNEYQARGKSDDIQFLLDTKNLPPGKYRLTVSIHENKSGRAIEKQTDIEIL